MVIDVIAGLIFTWVIGLAPAFIIRSFRHKAVSKKWSYIIAGAWCFILAIFAFLLKAAAGEAHPKISMAWLLVFYVLALLLRRPGPERRREIIAELEAIAGNENADAERRAWAQEKLGRLKAGSKN